MERIHTEKRRNRKPTSRQNMRKAAGRTTGQNLLRKYRALRAQFQETEITYQCHLFVRRTAASAPRTLSASSLLPRLYEVAKVFLLNELQVALWSLYLSRIVWKLPGEDVDIGLRLAALATKKYFDDEFEVYCASLKEKLQGIDEMWEQWTSTHSNSLSVSPAELRTHFQELSATPCERPKEEAVDYNQLIASILQMSPPLQPSQFDEELMKQLAGPSVLSLVGDDLKSGATAPSCSEEEGMKDEFNQCIGSAPEDEAFRWDFGTTLPRISSLSEIWPDLSKPTDRRN